MQHYLWRAVDQDGVGLDILVQARRDAQAAKRFFKRLLAGLQYEPRVIVTDKLRSYGVAQRQLLHYEIEGDGPPLVLQHGFTDSMETWYERCYVDALHHVYRLILIDARGHHMSDKPHDEAAYAEDRFAADIVAVLDKLKIERAHYWGYSKGGLIGFALGQYAPERFTTIIPVGASPYPMPPGVDTFIPILQRGVAGLKAI